MRSSILEKVEALGPQIIAFHAVILIANNNGIRFKGAHSHSNRFTLKPPRCNLDHRLPKPSTLGCT